MPFYSMAGDGSNRLVSKTALDDYGSSPHAEWLTVDWRNHLQELVINGRRVNFVDVRNAGDDEIPLLLVHGLGGCWQNWLENIPYFARSRRVIALDLPGFGASQMPSDRISIPGFSEFILYFCDRLGLKKIDLAGNSMGGLISADFASRHTDFVRRLTLVSPAGAYATDIGRLPLLPGERIDRALGSLAQRYRGNVVRRKRARWLVLNGIVRYPNRIRPELLYEVSAGFASPGFWAGLNAVLSHGTSTELERIEAPTLVIWGKSDRIVPARCADIFEKRLPNAQKVFFEKTGHVSMLERPSRFNRLMDEFLSASL